MKFIGKVDSSDINIDKENLNIAIDLAKQYFNAEEDRNKIIESKSIIYISILGVSIALLAISISNNLFNFVNTINIVFSSIAITLLLLIFIYSIRSIFFSYKVLKRRAFDLIGFNDFNIAGKKEKYLKHLILMYINCANKNTLKINEKVDFMVMSQEYFIRAVIVIFLYIILIIIKYFLTSYY